MKRQNQQNDRKAFNVLEKQKTKTQTVREKLRSGGDKVTGKGRENIKSGRAKKGKGHYKVRESKVTGTQKKTFLPVSGLREQLVHFEEHFRI